MCVFIDPYHPRDWADAIEKFIKHKEKIKEWEDKIHKSWKSVSWEESAKTVYNHLKLIHSGDDQQKQSSTLYYEIGLLFYAGGLTGIPRTEMLLARHLSALRKNIKFFFMNKGKYCELSKNQLSNLLSSQDLDTAVQKDRQSITGFFESSVPPFKKGDVVLSVGVGYDGKSYEKLIDWHKQIGFKYCQVLYDFTCLTVPHTHPKERAEQEYPAFLKNIYALSDFIFYGGQTAQKDGKIYQKNHNLPIKKSEALKWGSDFSGQKITEQEKREVFEKYGIEDDFILSVGTIEARKNQEILYDAYLELLRTEKTDAKLPQIVLCGHPGWKTNLFQHLLKVDNRIRSKVLLITPTDKELNVLYQSCLFTALPSFYEGWSLTLPESLNYGKLCLASDTPSLKETGEDIIDYANPYDPVEWAEKIKFYYTHRDALKQKEAAIKKKWHNTTWNECACHVNKTLDKLFSEG